MSVGAGGVEYENKVLRTIKPQIPKIKGLKLKEGSSTAAYAATEPDLVLLLNGIQINIEIKQDSKAQMGGGSYNYDMKTKKFKLSAKTVIDPAIDVKLQETLETKTKDLNKLLNYVKQNDAKLLSENVKGLPLTAAKNMWEELTSEKFLVPLNAKETVPYSFLHDHYAKKNCYYIQIGGSGLFYLKSNPLNLPIPQLKIPMAIELRLGRAGSKLNKTLKIDVASGNMRAQGRLDSKTKMTSPYSLDKAGDFLKLFGNISNNDLKKLK
jgi:hypothetical protein